MESTSLPGRIQISRSTYERVYDLGWRFEQRIVDVKGKGECMTYLISDNCHMPSLVNQEEENNSDLEINKL